jgi:hypothetical protein
MLIKLWYQRILNLFFFSLLLLSLLKKYNLFKSLSNHFKAQQLLQHVPLVIALQFIPSANGQFFIGTGSNAVAYSPVQIW